MENCIVNENNNDFLSQSYSQGIERITGTKDHTFNFQIPKELLEVREKTWDKLFNKYSKEMSDDIELNVDTLEPEEEEDEKAVSGEESNYGQRVLMRKPATLVQYWINTGNLPYKVLLNEKNELSETGSSLSEKEITSSVSPSSSLVTNVNAVNNAADDKRKCKNDSSCSSVDTAAYILSNANVTKKADTIAIIEGAKCVEIKSLKNIRVPSNNNLEITRIDRGLHDDGGDVNIPDTELHSMSTENTTSEVLTPANAVQSNIYSQSLLCEETDKIDKSSTSQKNLDVQTIDDIASIFRQFDKTSKRLIGNDKSNDTSNQQDKMVEMDTFHEKQISENVIPEIIAKDTSLTTLHRKKLYTGRDSPVDLILTETHGTNRLSQTQQSLHPALDSDDTIKRKITSIHEAKSKHSPSIKKNFISKKVKRKERRELDCSKIITDISNKHEYTNNSEIQDSNIDSSLKNLSDSHNNLNKQDDRTFRDIDSVKNEKYKQYLSSLNLRPVVLLQRIESSFEQRKFKFDKNNHKNDVRHNNHNKLCQDSNKYSILTFTSSDEDDFVRSIQHPRKRLKVSINDSTLGEPNIVEKNLCDQTKLINSDKNKYCYSRNGNNLSTVICSSKKIVQKYIRSIKGKKEHNRVVEIKSFDNDTQTATTSLQPHENEKFVFFSTEDDNDNATDNLNKHKKRISSFDSKKTINHNSKRHPNGVLKKTGVDHKDSRVIFFQTKTYDTNSSDSEESNSYTSCTYIS